MDIFIVASPYREKVSDGIATRRHVLTTSLTTIQRSQAWPPQHEMHINE